MWDGPDFSASAQESIVVLQGMSEIAEERSHGCARLSQCVARPH
jgi:hypothetical protein